MMKRTRLLTPSVSGASGAQRARFLLLGVLLALFAFHAMAQDNAPAATFMGKVIDPKGKPVEGAKVTLIKTDDEKVTFSGLTDKKGEFTLLATTAGNYRLRAEFTGLGPGERPVVAELGMLYKDADLQLGDEANYKANLAIESFNAGVKSLQARKPEEAVEHFKKSIEMKPDLPQAHYALAAALHGLQKWDEAAAAIDKYAALAPTDDRPEFHSLAFELYFESSQDDKAKAQLAKITDPKIRAELAPRVYNSGVQRHKAEDLEGAIGRFEMAADLDPNFAQAYQNIAAIEFNRQQYKQALVHLDKLLKAKPDSVEGLRMRFYSLHALGDEREKSALAAYLGKAPASAGEEVAKMGGDEFEAGHTESATKLLQALIEVKPDVAIAHYHLGRALASAGANAGAKTHLQHFVEMAPNHPDAKAAKQMIAQL
jgi:tetratricopeptide (TPR) repeat protein